MRQVMQASGPLRVALSAAMDWVRGRATEPGGSSEGGEPRGLPRRPRPRAFSIPWHPLGDGDPARLFEEPVSDELFVAQSVLEELRRHLPTAPGEQRVGFLLGRRFRCPVTNDPFLLVDQVLATTGSPPGRQGTARFDEALRLARDEAQARGREVLGWFHNHSTLMGLRLSEHDVRLHSQYFPEPWHCMAILVPDARWPTGGFFQRRDRNGYPGTRLMPFFEVLDRNATEGWETLSSLLDWVNYDTSRQGVRRPLLDTKTPPSATAASLPHPTPSPTEREAASPGPRGKQRWRPWIPVRAAAPMAPPAEEVEEAAPERAAQPVAGASTAGEAEATTPAEAEAPRIALEPPEEAPEPPVAPREVPSRRWTGIPAPYAAAPPEPAEASVSGEAAEPLQAQPVRAERESGAAPAPAPREGSEERAPAPPQAQTPVSRRARARGKLPFRLEPPEPAASSASLLGAVAALRSVVVARRPAPAARRPPAAHSPDELAVHYSTIPVVMPPSEELPMRWAALKVRLRRSRRSAIALLLIAVAGGVLLLGRGDGGSAVAPSTFHPAAGPPEGREAATAPGGEPTLGAPTRFDELHGALTARLAAYGERRQDFERGRIDCAGLAVGFHDMQRSFLRVSDYMASQQVRLTVGQQTAYRGLVGRTAEVNRHFEGTGCEP